MNTALPDTAAVVTTDDALAEITADKAPYVEVVAGQQMKAMAVQVKLDCGTRYAFEGMFRSSFDAFDSALNRFHKADRIEVKPLGRRPTLAAQYARKLQEAGHGQG